MNPGKIWITKRAGFLLLLISALALAMPAFAQIRPLGLSDSQEPGSVIIFKKFIKGVVTLPEGGLAPSKRTRDWRRLSKGFYLPRTPAGKNQGSLGLRHGRIRACH
jgi:hypothetical protein